MKWFKHETSDRNRVEAKLIKSKFGINGYGIYLSLLEVIGESIDEHNIKDWGHVDPMHDISTLAAECCITDEELRTFLAFCDERGIFEKKNGRLFSGLILRRLDEYANKIKSRSRVTPDKLPTKSRVSPARVEESRVEESKKRTEKKKGETTATSRSPEEQVMDVFYKINPTLNWGNKTTRSSAAEMIKQFGLAGTLAMAEQVISVQGKPFAPVAITPYQMKEKLSQFKIYFERHGKSGFNRQA